MSRRHSHHTMRQTSLDAAASVPPTIEERVLRAIQDAGDQGATDYELTMTTGVKNLSVGACRNKLMRQGKVVETDGRRPTDTGRMAIVWKAA